MNQAEHLRQFDAEQSQRAARDETVLRELQQAQEHLQAAQSLCEDGADDEVLGMVGASCAINDVLIASLARPKAEKS